MLKLKVLNRKPTGVYVLKGNISDMDMQPISVIFPSGVAAINTFIRGTNPLLYGDNSLYFR